MTTKNNVESTRIYRLSSSGATVAFDCCLDFYEPPIPGPNHRIQYARRLGSWTIAMPRSITPPLSGWRAILKLYDEHLSVLRPFKMSIQMRR